MPRSLFAVLGGALLALAMPPWGWWPLAFAAIVPLDRAVADASRKSRFRRGWLFGAAWFFPSIVWMADLTFGGYIAASLFYPLYYGVAVAVLPGDRWRWLGLPGAIVLAELLRWSWPFGGVPLSTIAMSHADSPLTPVVRVLGPLLLVACIAAIGVALSALWERQHVPAGIAIAFVALAWLASLIAPRSEVSGTFDVAVVQGGGPQNTRATETDERDVVDRHLEAARTIDRPVDLVVFPEDVFDVDGAYSGSGIETELFDLAADLGTPVVAGIVEDPEPDGFRNASVVVTPDRRSADRYDKVQRVPFGEYVPFRSLVSPLSGGAVETFIPKEAIAGSEPAVLESSVGTLGVSISWEIFFDHRARDAIGNGGQVLLNPTNGASYWLTIVQSQQVASSRLRALETDRWTLQAAPTGFSAVITPEGRVAQRTAVSEQRVLYATVELRDGQTLATRVGAWPMAILAVIAVLAANVAARRPDRWRDRPAQTGSSLGP